MFFFFIPHVMPMAWGRTFSLDCNCSAWSITIYLHNGMHILYLSFADVGKRLQLCQFWIDKMTLHVDCHVHGCWCMDFGFWRHWHIQWPTIKTWFLSWTYGCVLLVIVIHDVLPFVLYAMRNARLLWDMHQQLRKTAISISANVYLHNPSL